MSFSIISSNTIYQAKKIWFVRLYQKMIEIYQEKIKLRKLVHKKEIRRVGVGFKKKKKKKKKPTPEARFCRVNRIGLKSYSDCNLSLPDKN